MLHNKNETRSAALAVRFLLSVLVFFAETFAKALYFNSLKTSILWLSELDLWKCWDEAEKARGHCSCALMETGTAALFVSWVKSAIPLLRSAGESHQPLNFSRGTVAPAFVTNACYPILEV